MTDLSRTDQFFHGTTHEIADGMVRPANHAGTKISMYSEGDPGGLSGGDHAFAIRNDEEYAWRAALKFHKNGQRPRVYETEPAENMKPGPWNKENRNFLNHVTSTVNVDDVNKLHQDEWASNTGFKVKRQIDIAPGHQGTFPQINWNDYKVDTGPMTSSWDREAQARNGPDANHPSDHLIKWGGRGGIPDELDVARATPRHLSPGQFHDWHKDPPPHSVLREQVGRPQKRWETLFDA